MQEQDPLSGRKTQSLIHCVGDATVGLRYPCVDPPGPATQDVDRTIGRASIDDDMLDGHGTLHCNAFQAGFQVDRKSTRLNSSHKCAYRMPATGRQKNTETYNRQY